MSIKLLSIWQTPWLFYLQAICVYDAYDEPDLLISLFLSSEWNYFNIYLWIILKLNFCSINSPHKKVWPQAVWNLIWLLIFHFRALGKYPEGSLYSEMIWTVGTMLAVLCCFFFVFFAQRSDTYKKEQAISDLLHWENYVSNSFQIEWDMIVVTVFLSILNQMEFHLVQNRTENCHHDDIPFIVKGNGTIVFSVYYVLVCNHFRLG